MTTSYGFDQDAEPPTPDGQEPDLAEPDSDDPGSADELASHPDPEPGSDHAQAGSDS